MRKIYESALLYLKAIIISVLVLLIIGFAGVKVYKAKFSRRRNFNYTLSEDNGNIVGDENRVNC